MHATVPGRIRNSSSDAPQHGSTTGDTSRALVSVNQTHIQAKGVQHIEGIVTVLAETGKVGAAHITCLGTGTLSCSEEQTASLTLSRKTFFTADTTGASVTGAEEQLREAPAPHTKGLKSMKENGSAQHSEKCPMTIQENDKCVQNGIDWQDSTLTPLHTDLFLMLGDVADLIPVEVEASVKLEVRVDVQDGELGKVVEVKKDVG
ncbi:hypothetical protein E2C01_003876 [Portunus trituberculatus]|uniref:Uncharacterized protein n=1 Tax=Portunus trituberculatus TaxID=210409 RepID=A0A5B7CSC2_PORTR|nr:hypothetical protein [Portunus trituberculatus]